MRSRPPVRVLQVLGRLTHGGGVQTVVRGILANVDPAEIEMRVLITRPRFDVDGLDDIGATVRALGIAGPMRPSHRPRILAGTAAEVRAWRPDVVHLHSGMAWYATAARAVAPRSRYLIEVHDAPGSGRNGANSDRFEGLWVRRGGAHAVCHSSSVRTEIEQRWGAPPARVHQFPLGIDTDVMRPPPDRAVSSDTLVVVGRLVRSKRFDLAIDVVAELGRRGRHAQLVVVGHGPAQDDLVEHAARSGVGDRVHFVGARYGTDLASTIGSADVLLSTSEYEGFGLTLIEAMACGVPVVAMRAGGAGELLDHGGGRVVDAEDVAAMSTEVELLLDDDDGRREIGLRGRSVAEERYSVRATARQFTALYEELAGER